MHPALVDPQHCVHAQAFRQRMGDENHGALVTHPGGARGRLISIEQGRPMNLSLERLPTSSWRFKHLIAVLALGWVLAGCTRTVHWEEEVLLNTGETIWVKRSGTYTYRSASGNPLDLGISQIGYQRLNFRIKQKSTFLRMTRVSFCWQLRQMEDQIWWQMRLTTTGNGRTSISV